MVDYTEFDYLYSSVEECREDAYHLAYLDDDGYCMGCGY